MIIIKLILKLRKKLLEIRFNKSNIDKLLEESEKELDDNNTNFLSHEEVFSN